MPGDDHADREARLVAHAYRSQLLADVALRCAAASGPAELAQVTAEGALSVAGRGPRHRLAR